MVTKCKLAIMTNTCVYAHVYKTWNLLQQNLWPKRAHRQDRWTCIQMKICHSIDMIWQGQLPTILM